jgi:hypothetical protein
MTGSWKGGNTLGAYVVMGVIIQLLR